MRTVAIIQARMGSTRLPGKVLMDLCGKPVLEWVVEAAKAAKGIDDIRVAIPWHAANDKIAQWCKKNGVKYCRGAEKDVLKRYVAAAKLTHADVIVRLTADCPMLDYLVIEQVIALRERTGADYASNVDPPSWPDGQDVEVFTRDALLVADDEAKAPYDREHVTPFLRSDKKRFHCENLVAGGRSRAHIKWSVDTKEDLENIREYIRKVA